MNFPKIQSRQNPKIARLVALREQKKARERENAFVIEGRRELARALENGIEIREIYFCEEQIRSAETKNFLNEISKSQNVEIAEISAPAMEKASYRENPEGVIAVAKTFPTSLENLQKKLRGNDKISAAGTTKIPELFLVVEAVEKPGNLGALLRIADSAGCSALICCEIISDIFNPNAIRASQGTLFSVPVAVASKEKTAEFLRSRDAKIFAASPSAEKILWSCDFRSATAFVLGNEADGLSDFWLKTGKNCRGNAAEDFEKISIPQLGNADSLNVSTAAAICLFEAVRQRKIF